MGATEGKASFRAPAAAYDRFVGRYGPQLAASLLEAAAVRSGMRALDVGCGPGALTSALAELLGADHVAGIDPSEPFVAACRRRLPGADIRLGAAESLPFGDGIFDAVLSQLAVNFLDDPAQGVAEMRRVSAPGAIVAACVWDYADGMTMLRTFWDAAVRLDPQRATELDEGRMRHCNPEELRALWEAGELREVEVDALEVSAAYADFDDLWTPFLAGVGPAGAYCASLDEDRRAQLREEIRHRLDSPAGRFELTARAWSVVGRA